MAARLIAVVRHADAGVRDAFTGNDDLRPLSRRGRLQAEALSAHLGLRPWAVVSSPSLRCIATVLPLARAGRLPLITSDALYEGRDPAAALAALVMTDAEVIVGCTHGDIVAGILEELANAGVSVPQPRAEKGSTWLLQLAAGVVTAARYLPPPP